MGESSKDLWARAKALQEEGKRALVEAEALFARARWLDKNGRTELQDAILFGRKTEAKDLLRARVDPNETGETCGRPPLVLALEAVEKEYSPSLVKALIKAGADPNAKHGNGRSVLTQAIRYEELEIALALLKAGANPNDPDASGALERHFREVVNIEYLDDKERGVVEAIRGLLRGAP